MSKPAAVWTPERAGKFDADLALLPATRRIQAAYDYFGDNLVLSSSFGIQSAVMLHLATQIYPKIPVIFIDTGYLFKETYLFAQALTERLRLNIKKYQAVISPAEQEALYGKLWEAGKEGLQMYNHTRKVEPMNRALRELGAQAWLAGLRRVQASSRKDLTFVKQQKKTTKIHPILDWTDRDIHQYLTTHDLPYHPLWEKGYISVGDTHSTCPLLEGMQAEDTRFRGIKRECGLHETSSHTDYQI